MGFVKESELYYSSHGLSSVPEKSVCHKHFSDKSIKEFIASNELKNKCAYCNSLKSVGLETLMFYMMRGIMRHYVDAAEFMIYISREGGYQGTIYSPEELINDQIGLEVDNDYLLQDIITCIDDRAWADPYTYHDNQKDIFVYHWSYFKEVTKYKSRYLFSKTAKLKSNSYQFSPYDILEDIGSYISTFNMTSILSKGTALNRCRQHSNDESIKQADQMSSPPRDKATIASRMSPSGIPMFYCAFDEKTAIIETIDLNDTTKPLFTTCNFVTRNELKVIDFRKLPPRVSIFDEKNFSIYYVLQFLHEFVQDLSKGISKDGKEQIEYVPTQILTEYFRYVYPENIIGIVYPSSKSVGSSACVLFFDQEESLENLKFMKTSLKTMSVI